MPSLSWLYWSFHWSVLNLIATNLFTTFFTTSLVLLELLQFPCIYMQSLTTTFAKSVSIQHLCLMCTPWILWQKAPLIKRASMRAKTKSLEMVQHYNANWELSRKLFVLAQRNVFFFFSFRDTTLVGYILPFFIVETITIFVVITYGQKMPFTVTICVIVTYKHKPPF